MPHLSKLRASFQALRSQCCDAVLAVLEAMLKRIWNLQDGGASVRPRWYP